MDIRQRNHYASQADGHTTPQFLSHITDCIRKNSQVLQQFEACGESGSDVGVAEEVESMYLINYWLEFY